MTLFERVFGGNDAVYGLTEAAVDAAIAANGEEKAVSFPDTAYALPCYYAVTGVKVTNLKEMKEALGVVKSLMTRENQLNDVFMSGVATALCAEFIEAIKYIDGAKPYDEPCYGHLSDAIIRELGVPLVTGDIPGVAVILGSAPTAQEGVDLVKSYQAQGILVTLVGGIIDQCQVLKEEGRRAQTQSFMWLFRSGEDGLAEIILYGYSPTRSGSHAKEFLEGYSSAPSMRAAGSTGHVPEPQSV